MMHAVNEISYYLKDTAQEYLNAVKKISQDAATKKYPKLLLQNISRCRSRIFQDAAQEYRRMLLKNISRIS